MEQEKVEKLLRAKLKERGLKITQQRLLVLSTLAKSNGNHMAAEELLNDVRNYLDITYSDTDGDTKLIGIITRGMAYLELIMLRIGVQTDEYAEDNGFVRNVQ